MQWLFGQEISGVADTMVGVSWLVGLGLGLIQTDRRAENKKILKAAGNGKSPGANPKDDRAFFKMLVNGITEEPKVIPNIRLPLN
jgi:hypothetical protein